MKHRRLLLIASATASGLILLSPAMAPSAWAQPTSAPSRKSPRVCAGFPGKLGLCVPPCSPTTPALYTQPHPRPLSNTPAPIGARAPDLSAPLEGPFPSADDPPPLTVIQRIVAALPMLTVYGGITTWAYFAWYHNQPMNRRMVVNTAAEEGFGGHTYGGGADKLGHFYANYLFARVGAQSLINRGWSPLSAVLMHVSFTLTLYTLVEIKDGYHPGYGFSIQDYAANVLGNVVATLLLLVPSLDRLFGVRMYYKPSKLFVNALLYDKDIDVSEDYTGETVMLVFKLGGLTAIKRSPHFRFLRFVDLLIGYNARGFLPRPDPSVMREQELFLGFSLNLAQILQSAYPTGQRLGWAAQGLATLSEYLQLTPVHKTVGIVWSTRQPQ